MVSSEFRDDEKRLRVISRENFVGRRRQLQNCLRTLKTDQEKVGVLLHGMGGLGKTSIVSRLWDRLPNFEKVFWREKTSSTRKTPTRHSAGKMYQRSPSEPTALIPHSFLPNRASRRWKYSHRARILGPSAKQNQMEPPDTLASGPFVLLR
jgi:hypothetical protein